MYWSVYELVNNTKTSVSEYPVTSSCFTSMACRVSVIVFASFTGLCVGFLVCGLYVGFAGLCVGFLV